MSTYNPSENYRKVSLRELEGLSEALDILLERTHGGFVYSSEDPIGCLHVSDEAVNSLKKAGIEFTYV